MISVRALAVCSVTALALALGPSAAGSELLARNATDVQLAVSRQGIALVTYEAAGRRRHALVWGAENARHPHPTVPQVAFKIDYSGGWRTFHRRVWRTLRNACLPYDGPALTLLVAACKAPDGTYWALQSWQRQLPNMGFEPWLPRQRDWELRISHWQGPLAELEVWRDWIFGGEAEELFGRLTYLGVAVHGFRKTGKGEPLDGYGRNVYIDTFNSAFGPGWRRETGIVTHRPSGSFCHAFYPATPYPHYPSRARRPAGNGERYRVLVVGPGVTPDVAWDGDSLGGFDAGDRVEVAHERQMNALLDRVTGDDPRCVQH